MSQTATNKAQEEKQLGFLCDHGRQLVAAGDIKQAIRVYQIACLKHPFEPSPWIGLGLCQKQLGEAGAAASTLTAALALGAVHPRIPVHLAECYLQLKRPKEARKNLDHAIRAAKKANDSETLSRAYAVLALLKSEVPQ